MPKRSRPSSSSIDATTCSTQHATNDCNVGMNRVSYNNRGYKNLYVSTIHEDTVKFSRRPLNDEQVDTSRSKHKRRIRRHSTMMLTLSCILHYSILLHLILLVANNNNKAYAFEVYHLPSTQEDINQEAHDTTTTEPQEADDNIINDITIQHSKEGVVVGSINYMSHHKKDNNNDKEDTAVVINEISYNNDEEMMVQTFHGIAPIDDTIKESTVEEESFMTGHKKEPKPNYYSAASSFASSSTLGTYDTADSQIDENKPLEGMVTTQSITTTEQQTQTELSTICTSLKGNAMLPLLSTSCKQFVNCYNGNVVQHQSCAQGTIFDVNILGCNWVHLVNCPVYQEAVDNSGGGSDGIIAIEDEPESGGKSDGSGTSSSNTIDISSINFNQQGQDPVVSLPTNKPSNMPTRQPSSKPSNMPTKKPIQQASTNQPTSKPQNQQQKEDQGNIQKLQNTPKPSPQATTPPNLFTWLQAHRRELNTNIFRSQTKDGVNYRSYWFQYQDFYQALQLVSGGNSGRSITGNTKHLFYVGNDNVESSWEYGLVNVANFLAQSMVESISSDACDEYSHESNTDDDAAAKQGDDGNTKKDTSEKYAISNSCGQNNMNYQDMKCSADESYMACDVDRSMILQATTSAVYPNAPPPLSCRPRSVSESYTGYWDGTAGKEMSIFPYENSFGRTDIEGCCYWGRGALQTKGVCSIGKLNYYLGKRAADEGRPSRYPNTDFCAFPEAICAAPESREMRWVTSMFEWTERVQSYDDGKGWNYMKKLKEFVDGGFIDNDFIIASSGILTKGCHEPPCDGGSSSSFSINGGQINGGGFGEGEVYKAEERNENFRSVLLTLEAGGEDALLRGLIAYFDDRQDVMNSQILRSQTPQGQLYPSYRYQLPDFLSALTHISEKGIGGRKFYIGEPRMNEGVRYGVVNAIMFLSQAYKESIQYDACDENNWELVNDRFPLSNAWKVFLSCNLFPSSLSNFVNCETLTSSGQLGMSYQDMHCREDEAFMECPVKLDMEQVALTNAGWFQAPAPLKCGPKSKYPRTGFWDYDLGRENNNDAYANSNGRVDVEGCCWWGRGIIQTRGTCQYGKLNYFMGKRAADEGREALYPQIDFCEFPQGVCSSDETYGGELQWMVGFFEWTHRIQEYDVDGWNYIEKLKEFVDGGYEDWSFVDAVSGILNIGCHDPPCAGFGDKAVDPHNKRDRNDTFQRFLNQLQVARSFRPPPKPTPLPTSKPTLEPTNRKPTTVEPTQLDPPTETPTKSSAPTALQGRPPPEAVEAMEEKIIVSQDRFADLLLLSQHPSGEMWPSYLYTWSGFQRALKKMTSGTGPGEKNFFYVGDGYTAKSLEYGLVNMAAFVSHAIVKSIHYDACDENSYDLVNFRYPLSNSCGQGGESYQDEVCEREDDVGLECEVDTNMEIMGVTHAGWVGAPPPMYCGDRNVGYWDHITGLEQNEIPYENNGGRSDVRGCCWWGRGALQVRGVCSYGKLNHWIGAKAAAEGRPSLYPDIDFCKNPGAICSDRRSPELRWVTGMFHWVHTVQRNRDFDYFPTLKRFVDGGDYTDGSFIGMVNAMLGGNGPDISKRTKTFFNALRAFNLIAFEGGGNSTALDVPDLAHCGVDFNDASEKCTPCTSNQDCSGLDLCYANVEACFVEEVIVDEVEGNGTDDTYTDDLFSEDTSFSTSSIAAEEDIMDGSGEIVVEDEIDAPAIGDESAEPAVVAMSASMSATSWCGASWQDAASQCTKSCPSGTDNECFPGSYCFGQITTCSDIDNSEQETTGNFCGTDWNDAHAKCSITCPGGTDVECPPNHSCFGDIDCR